MSTRLDLEQATGELSRCQKSLEAKRLRGEAPTQDEMLIEFQLKLRAHAVMDSVQAEERRMLDAVAIRKAEEPITEIAPTDEFRESLKGYSPSGNSNVRIYGS